jgi:hypothetical protein
VSPFLIAFLFVLVVALAIAIPAIPLVLLPIIRGTRRRRPRLATDGCRAVGTALEVRPDSQRVRCLIEPLDGAPAFESDPVVAGQVRVGQRFPVVYDQVDQERLVVLTELDGRMPRELRRFVAEVLTERPPAAKTLSTSQDRVLQASDPPPGSGPGEDSP